VAVLLERHAAPAQDVELGQIHPSVGFDRKDFYSSVSLQMLCSVK
jgi:hypothetical protein